MAINPSKNLLIIIDRFSELDLELENLSQEGIKQILVSDLNKIDKSYFKLENENLKITENKIGYHRCRRRTNRWFVTLRC